MRVSMNEKEPEQERNVNNLTSRVKSRITDIFPNREKDEFDRLLKKVLFCGQQCLKQLCMRFFNF